MNFYSPAKPKSFFNTEEGEEEGVYFKVEQAGKNRPRVTPF